ncbi:MAG: iron-sulfur cluster-binding protein, partial [Candidatus Heimdallarchaeaceae archaeon]
MKKQTLVNTKPLMGKIIKKQKECEDTYTFLIKLPVKNKVAKPGQFVMLWIPGVDEYPIGIAGFENNVLEICVAKMGFGTSAMLEKQVGDYVGIRGFYGKSFQPPKNVNHLILGGGFGMTPLKFLTNSLIEKGDFLSIHVFEGARTKEKLLYLDWLQTLHDEEKITFHACTDDGSFGFQGFPTVPLERFLEESDKPSVLYVAGPEKMMKVIFELGRKYKNVVDMQMSLADRYMRCGFGLCSYCTVDPTGWRVCVDGPVFNA